MTRLKKLAWLGIAILSVLLVWGAACCLIDRFFFRVTPRAALVILILVIVVVGLSWFFSSLLIIAKKETPTIKCQDLPPRINIFCKSGNKYYLRLDNHEWVYKLSMARREKK